MCVCLSVTSHISETSEAIASKFDKVTASVMTLHHISNFSCLHLDVWPHEHVLKDTGQCMLSERAFGVERLLVSSESVNDVRNSKMMSN